MWNQTLAVTTDVHESQLGDKRILSHLPGEVSVFCSCSSAQRRGGSHVQIEFMQRDEDTKNCERSLESIPCSKREVANIEKIALGGIGRVSLSLLFR